MFFKNLTVYRLGQLAHNAASLSQALAPHRFAPCSSLDMQSIGWVPPRNDDNLAYAVGGCLFVELCIEKKLLPASVINEAAKVKAAELEETQGYRPGRKQMREIKEAVTDELLPRAFSTLQTVRAYLDTRNGWLVVDAVGARCEDVLKFLIKGVEKFPVDTLRTARSPVASMTDWLASDVSPFNFTVDDDAELRATGENKATVQYKRHALNADDIGPHIAAGKQCTRLALTWADRVSFVLTESLAIRRVVALDILKEDSEAVLNDDERFDTDATLMCGEFNKLLGDLVEVLGGEVVVE